ncbi:MAG: bifunctional diaminohydroxyphosphoribosylaminopyrimidine deaminase/5-amino-6-(5-phosphoribosylamino)uracil reductase RibD [Gemmatimonadaceae bacterium]
MLSERPAGALWAARESAFMRRALVLARRGWGWTAPNPMVGAVVVRDDVIVGEGWHARYGGPHAEVVALEAAGEAARGSTVYVTLEPCSHTGKTPPCTAALIRAGVARVVCAARDPNPIAQGGAARLESAGIEVAVGLEESAAFELNAPFFTALTSSRPWVTLKLATSIDGAIADAAGRSRWLTGTAARRYVHRLRAGNDAIAVGVRTALADDPSLTVRSGRRPRVPPARVVFDRRARLPLNSELVRTARDVRTIVVSGDASSGESLRLASEGVHILEGRTLDDALRALRGLDIRSLLVEGGAELAGALLAAGNVDRMIIFQAPVVLGAGARSAFAHVPAAALPDAPRWRVIDRRRLGADLMTVYASGAS